MFRHVMVVFEHGPNPAHFDSVFAFGLLVIRLRRSYAHEVRQQAEQNSNLRVLLPHLHSGNQVVNGCHYL